uniref:Uncharacterized protein n=1 Tax=Anguilla anguilla TaxID=7936 RepID=A0A0E9RA81_ANGAN
MFSGRIPVSTENCVDFCQRLRAEMFLLAETMTGGSD